MAKANLSPKGDSSPHYKRDTLYALGACVPKRPSLPAKASPAVPSCQAEATASKTLGYRRCERGDAAAGTSRDVPVTVADVPGSRWSLNTQTTLA